MSMVLECSGCHESYVGRRWRPVQYCRNCKSLAAHDRVLKSRKARRVRIETGTVSLVECVSLFEAVGREIGVTVVRDPEADCGFSAGIYFPHDEWVGMLKHQAFTPGTVLRGSSGRLYKT